jgi:8-oxo-dGTP diphosphatase
MTSVPTAKLIASVVVRNADRALIFFEEGGDGTMKYNLPGGHVEIGEIPTEAAVREVKEEAGLDITLTSLLQVTVNTWKQHHSVLIYFIATAPSDAEMHTEEGITASWKTAEEVAALPEEQCIFGVKEAVARSFVNSETTMLLEGKNGVRVD